MTKTDDEKIATAVAEGKVRKIATGTSSGWDDLSFKERHQVLVRKHKARQAKHWRIPGTHLNICNPKDFYKAWKAIGDLTDEQCEMMALAI